jgi:hypothetical protein
VEKKNFILDKFVLGKGPLEFIVTQLNIIPKLEKENSEGVRKSLLFLKKFEAIICIMTDHPPRSWKDKTNAMPVKVFMDKKLVPQGFKRTWACRCYRPAEHYCREHGLYDLMALPGL